jgi:pimeloyl-ACP methyl ester carboxylesterase
MELASRSFVSPAAKAVGRLSTLTILHGLLGNKNNWATLAEKFVAHPDLKECCQAIYSLDMRNHGDSPHSVHHSLDVLADDLDLFLHTKVRSVARPEEGSTTTTLSTPTQPAQANVVMAHSMGGACLMHSMLRHYGSLGSSRGVGVDVATDLWGPRPPSLVRGAVIVDITPFKRPPETLVNLRKYLSALNAMPLKEMKELKQADEWLKDKVPDNSLRGFMLTNLRFYPRGGTQSGAYWVSNISTLKDSLTSVVLAHEPKDFLGGKGKCDIPVLFVFGEKSEYNTMEGRSLIKQFFSNVVDEVAIPNAGHFVHYEQKDKFVDAVAPFIKDIMLTG